MYLLSWPRFWVEYACGVCVGGGGRGGEGGRGERRESMFGIISLCLLQNFRNISNINSAVAVSCFSPLDLTVRYTNIVCCHGEKHSNVQPPLIICMPLMGQILWKPLTLTLPSKFFHFKKMLQSSLENCLQVVGSGIAGVVCW